MAKVLCMEVGTSTVRLAEVSKMGKKVQITKVHVFDTPDDATKDGKVRVSDSVVSAIKDGIDDSGIKATDVYFAVESTKILFKQVELPLVPKNKIQSTLDLAFSDIFPVDETLYHLSYVFEKKYQKNGQWMMALDVFAIPNDLSESYYNLSVALGLNAKGLTDTSRSMISLFPDSFKNRNIAMVNINENSSTLTITVDGDMVFNKTIPHGVYNAVQHIMNSPLTMDGIEFNDAIGHLYTQNILMRRIPDTIPEQCSNEERLKYDVTMSVVQMVKTIETTFAAFLSKANIQINEFHLSGLGAGFGGITQLLEYEFGIPVTVVQQDGNLSIHPSTADEPLLLSCYPCAGAAIDAANFFTAAEKAGGEIAAKKRIDRLFIFVGVIVCLVSLGYSAYSIINANIALQNAQIENSRLEKKVQELRDRGVEVAYNNYNSAISYNEEVINLYDETRSGNEDMVVFLEELETMLPLSARVSAITITPKSATVSFVCEDKFVAAGVLHLLRNMKTTHSMECNGVAEVENSNEIAFTCEFTLKSTADRNPTKPEDGETETPVEPDIPVEDTSKLIVSTKKNTDEDISKITIGEESFAMTDLTLEKLQALGYTASGTMYMADNKAVTMVGRVFTDASGVELNITETADGTIDILCVENDSVKFVGDIYVGMPISDAIDALSSAGIEISNDNYLIVKNDTHAIVMCKNIDGSTIESIYIFTSSAIEQLDSNENNTDVEMPEIDDNEMPNDDMNADMGGIE